MLHRLLAIVFFLCSFLLLFSSNALALPEPEQVGVIANKNSADSVALAKHYANAREIPRSQVFLLDLPLEETVSRESYQSLIVDPIREKLSAQRFGTRVRILALMYGVPLRVQAPQANEEAKSRMVLATGQLESARKEILAAYFTAESVGRPEEKKPELPKTGSEMEFLRLTDASLKQAAKRIASIEPAESREQAQQQLVGAITLFGGPSALLANLTADTPEREAQLKAQSSQLKQEIASAKAIIPQLKANPTKKNLGRMYDLTRRYFGATGVLALASKEKETRSFKDADASVDSELSLLWWDRGSYEVNGRLPNPYYYRSLLETSKAGPPLPVLLVSRIDGPSPEIVRKQIDNTLLAEKNGLKGVAYVDAKGDKLERKRELSVWDQKLRDLAWMLRRVSDYRVTLDNYPELLSEAPDTALYSGWYQLRNYNDVFQFAPGAIGYHIASEEAVSIRNPEEKGWCKNMLERGVSATLGAIAEPYLDSFPEPRHFFGLLLTGKYSLVEAYALSSKYISWRMVLFGDPLYNPFRGEYEVPVKELGLLRDDGALFEELPPAPIRRFEIDPIEARRKLAQKKEQIQAKIDAAFGEGQKGGQAPQPELP